MRYFKNNIIRQYLLLLCLFLAGCGGTRQLQEGEVLFSGYDFTYPQPKKVNNKGLVEEELSDKIRLQPNTRLLGLFRTKLWIYYHVKEPKKEKGLRRWLKYKVGEPPVLYNENDMQRVTLYMEKYLRDNGYFDGKVAFETSVKNKTARVLYTIETTGQHQVGLVNLPEGKDEISRHIRSKETEINIKSGDPYSLEELKECRDIISDWARNLGYYDFTKEEIYYYVDTTRSDKIADIYFKLKPGEDRAGHIKYFLGDIHVYPNYSLDKESENIQMDSSKDDGLLFFETNLFVRHKVLNRMILLDKGESFSQRDHRFSTNHLLDLGVYKFVNFKYKKTAADTLDTYIYLTPSPTQDVTAEINASTTSTNFLGTNAAFAYTHRNIFKGAEQLNLSISGGVETQLNSERTFINTLDLDAEASLYLPRFLVPFKLKNVSLYYVPQTKISLKNNFQQRIQFYTANSFSFEFGYDWRENEHRRHQLNPFSVTRIRLLNTTPEFDAILLENPSLKASFQDVTILGINYTYLYTGQQLANKKSYLFFRGNIDMAGNTAYGIAQAVNPGKESAYVFLGLPFAQYFKTELDTRFYMPKKKTNWANRIVAGLAIPYGNSTVVPYLKQFFVGGSTSIRAFHLRSVGPGSYSKPEGESSNADFFDQTGDVKLELNTEYRFDIFRFLEGALFIDAGNVWLLREDPLRPNANFETDRFWKEFAIGTGAGLRLDFEFFILRLDAAFPLRLPSLEEGNRWVTDKIQPFSGQWRKDNLVWNLAIGYPF